MLHRGWKRQQFGFWGGVGSDGVGGKYLGVAVA